MLIKFSMTSYQLRNIRLPQWNHLELMSDKASIEESRKNHDNQDDDQAGRGNKQSCDEKWLKYFRADTKQKTAYTHHLRLYSPKCPPTLNGFVSLGGGEYGSSLMAGWNPASLSPWLQLEHRREMASKLDQSSRKYNQNLPCLVQMMTW